MPLLLNKLKTQIKHYRLSCMLSSLKGRLWGRRKVGLEKQNRSAMKHNEAQRSTMKHNEAQRSTTKHNEAQWSTMKHNEALRASLSFSARLRPHGAAWLPCGLKVIPFLCACMPDFVMFNLSLKCNFFSKSSVHLSSLTASFGCQRSSTILLGVLFYFSGRGDLG